MTAVELEALLRPGRECYMHARHLTTWVGHPLTADEAGGFLRSLDCDTPLVRLTDDEMYVELVGFPPKKTPKRYALYGSWKGSAFWSWREMFIQITFATELVLDHHWAADAVLLEYGLDVGVVPDAHATPVLLAEAKTDANDLAYVLDVLGTLSEDPQACPPPIMNGKLLNAVRKYEALARYQPRYYVEVAPDVRHAYELSYVPMAGTPPRVVIGPEREIPAAPVS